MDPKIKNRIFKEIYYRLESKKFEVFIDDANEVITIAKNVCSSCNRKWHQEYNQCIFCGSINYFVYICKNCGDVSSITSAKSKEECKKCSQKNTRYKSCINKECISNSSKNLKRKIAKKYSYNLINMDVLEKQIRKNSTKQLQILENFKSKIILEEDDIKEISDSRKIIDKWEEQGFIKKTEIQPTEVIKDSDIVIKDLIIEATDNKGLFNAKKGSLSISQMWCLHCGNNLDKYYTAQVKTYIVDKIEDFPNNLDKNSDYYIFNYGVKNFLTLDANNFNKEDIKNSHKYKDNINLESFLIEKDFV